MSSISPERARAIVTQGYGNLTPQKINDLKSLFPKEFEKASELSIWNFYISPTDEEKIASIFGKTYPDARTLASHYLQLTNWYEMGYSASTFNALITAFIEKDTYLALYNCQLKALPPAIFQLPWIKHLDLDFNDFTSIPDEIYHFTQLESLSMTHNKISEIPDKIQALTNLVKLNLRENKLERISRNIGSLIKLETVDLSYNRLTSLPEEIGNFRAITSLHLNNNQLTTLPETAINRLNRLTTLDYGANPISQFPTITLPHLRLHRGVSRDSIVDEIKAIAETNSNINFSSLDLTPNGDLDLFLKNLRDSAEMRSAHKKEFANRILTLLTYAAQHPDYRNGRFVRALANPTCEDRATYDLDALELSMEIEQARAKDIQTLIPLIKKSFIVHELDKTARSKVGITQRNTHEEVEVYLAFRTKVASMLREHLGSHTMLYEESATLTNSDYEEAANKIRSALQDLEVMTHTFLNQPEWKESLEKTFGAEKEQETKAISDQMAALEPGGNDQNYKMRVDTLQKQYEEKEKKWYETKTAALLREHLGLEPSRKRRKTTRYSAS